jgi:DNA-binding NtrC family response regulator
MPLLQARENGAAPPPAPATTAPLVLIVEDEPDVAALLRRVIEAAGDYRVRVCLDGGALDRILAEGPPDLVFTDLMMSGLDGFQVIARAREIDPDVPVVVVSAYSTIENAVKAVKAGAFDFLPKPFSPESVELVLAKTTRDRGLRERAAELSRQARERDPDLRALLGESVAMRGLREWILRVRDTRTNVLIEGESGTGKELVARALHAGRGPFVAVNLAAVPNELAEAELFGHRRGAFTGATTDRPGLIIEADGGTLFLDEVNAATPAVQAKLLRVIEDRRLRPVGANAEVTLDFRLVCATNQRLDGLVEAAVFRRDLYHRLKVLHVEIPPLRAHREDVPLLAEHFLARYARAHGRRTRRFSPSAMSALFDASWPGNVRELENAVEQAVILCEDTWTEVPREVLPPALGGRSGLLEVPASEDAADGRTLAEVEARHIHQVLRETGGNKSAAARILGIDYKTLLRRLAASDQNPP